MQKSKIFQFQIENQPLDVEYIRLLHDVFAKEMQGHLYRGYTIVESEALDNKLNKVKHYSGKRNPICFVFSSIGSQWFGMGIFFFFIYLSANSDVILIYK